MTASMLIPHAYASRRATLVSYGRRLRELATTHPQRAAIVLVAPDGSEKTVSYAQLDRLSTRAGRLLLDRGVRPGRWVVVGLPNSIEHYAFVLGAWKAGAGVLPVSSRLPERERREMLAMADPAAVVAEWQDEEFLTICPSDLQGVPTDVVDLPDVTPCPGKAIGSGGSTGRPKIIVDPDPWANAPGDVFEGLARGTGMAPDQVQLIAGPLYHNAPFCWGHWGLFEGHTLVVMQRFDADIALQLFTRHGIGFALLVPTMLHRMLSSPLLAGTDFSKVDGIIHSAAPCPPWVKREWLQILGPERFHEAYGSTESSGYTFLTGREWLAHPGSVGRPMHTDVQVVDADGEPCAPGEVGEVYMRMVDRPDPTYRYIGADPAPTLPGGFVSVGDLGWLDDEGFLFLADRRVDLILTGGANVYPAEVEAVLTEHPAVADVAVIGLPDDDWGKRVHAVVQPTRGSAESLAEVLDAHCRERLAPFKVPKSYELVNSLPREDSGKLRRTALIAERIAEAVS